MTRYLNIKAKSIEIRKNTPINKTAKINCNALTLENNAGGF